MNQEKETTKVWDPVVRIFHWSLVLFFFTAMATGEHWMGPHVVAGYTVLGLILFRALWGVIGTPHARFSDFIFPPRAVFGYLKDLGSLRAKRYIGHGPAGGSMVIALLISLLITTVTGLAAYGGKEYVGPLAGVMALADGSWTGAAKETHAFFAGFTVFLVALHVAGVLFSSFAHRENLIRAMFTGDKRSEETEHGEAVKGDRFSEEAHRKKLGAPIPAPTLIHEEESQ